MSENKIVTERVRRQFDRAAPAWDAEAADNTIYFTYRIPYICDLLSKHLTGTRCLDIGCAAGTLSHALALKRMDVYGTDLSEEMIRQARSRLSSLVDNTEDRFRISQHGEIPFEGMQFDMITAFSVLMYVPRRRDYLLNLRSYLKPGGVVVASNYNRFSLHTALSIIRQLQYFRPNLEWVTIVRNLWRTGFWSGGTLSEYPDEDISSATHFDNLLSSLGFQVVDEMNFYNLRPRRYHPFDGRPLDRTRIGEWFARHLAWEHFGVFKSV